MKKNVLIIVCITLALFSCAFFLAKEKKQYHVKTVKFANGLSLDRKVDIASRLIPTRRQLAWQQLELTAFLHFGINTFTGREWGDGTEDPRLFNPGDFDAGQWISTLKDAGFKLAIITAKHHDGFCLWPTKTTRHSVQYSPWKNGCGDVVKEVKEACDRYGLKFGIYLSPWDRNADCYGDSPRYNQFFIDQLTELLTNYGEVHEVWFDGANGEGPNGAKQIYDWQEFYEVIHRLQPNAVTAIKGDDVRWVGNEDGYGRETEWSATALTPSAYHRGDEQNKKLGINSQSKDLGSRELLDKATELFWYPSEVDVSIRPGWFYRIEEDDKVKSLRELTDIYFKSVGYNSVLLLNIPPDDKGRINKKDSIRLMEFARHIKIIFDENYVREKPALWKARKGDAKEYSIKNSATINTILLQEDISEGQRVESFSCKALIDDNWIPVAEGTTIGYKRIVRFDDCRPAKIRITINETRNRANISSVGAYYAPNIAADENESSIKFTIDE
jgi:alpha-L-fucosidase